MNIRSALTAPFRLSFIDLLAAVAIALLASWLIGMTMTPLQCIDLLPDPKEGSEGSDPFDTPFFRGYRPQFFFRTTDVTGAVNLDEGVEMVIPGDNTNIEVELITHAAADSARMSSCTISATMGNYGLLRRIHLKDARIVSALDLWKDERLQPMGFFAWRTWPGNELVRTADARYYVQLSTDSPDPSAAEHDANVAPHWRYVGKKAIHYWRTEADAHPHVAVNGRLTYWMSQSPIPGGAAFENFELRIPFEPGRRLWFGVRPDVDQRRE